MHAAAADIVGIAQWRAVDQLGLFMLVASESLRMTLAAAPDQLFILRVRPLVVTEIARLQMRALFKHDNGETRCRQFSCHDAARRTRTDDHKIHFFARGETCLCHDYSPLAI